MLGKGAEEIAVKVLEELRSTIVASVRRQLAEKEQRGSSENDENGSVGNQKEKQSVPAGNGTPGAVSVEPEGSKSNEGVNTEKRDGSRRVWIKRKEEGLVIEKLNDKVEYNVWERNFRMASKLTDLEDVLFDGVENPPIVEEKDVSERTFLARNLLFRGLDDTYWQYVQTMMNPKEMVQRIREFREPTTMATGFAVWTALKDFRYDLSKSVTQNVADFDSIVGKYNTCVMRNRNPCKECQGMGGIGGISNDVKREIFICSLPPKAKRKTADTLRGMKIEDATYQKVINMVHGIEKEIELERSGREKEMALLAGKDNKRWYSEKRDRYREDRDERDQRDKKRGRYEQRSYNRNENEEVKCYNCNKPGHLSRDCTLPDRRKLKKCDECKEMTDHDSSKCPEREERKAKARAIHSLKKSKKDQGKAHLAASDASVTCSSDDDNSESDEDNSGWIRL